MDPGRRPLIAGFIGLLSLAAGAWAQAPLSLREAGWLGSEGRLEALSSEPDVPREAVLLAAEAMAASSEPSARAAQRSDALTGEFLFQAPLLLGGQAAKAGLSCHSCHTNGRANPNFQFAAISGEPGTADTTHSFFSKTLGNAVFDPVAIPDLTAEGKVGHDRASGDLEAFITRIVVDEFSGSPEVDADEIIRPLATYVRALRLADLPDSSAQRPRSLTRDIDDIGETAEQARLRLQSGQTHAASLLLSSAQSQLQFVYERLIAGDHEDERDWLVARAREAGEMRRSLSAGERLDPAKLADWIAALQSSLDFARIEPQTLYNPSLLAKALAN